LKNNYFLYKYKDNEYKFFLDNYTFTPTHTSNMIIESSLKNIDSSGKLLDLGCGCGIVGILIGKLLDKNLEIYASDISDTVEEIVKINANKYNINLTVKKSNIFEKWKDMKFDYIINDISGVSSLVSTFSPWFNNISCESGERGDILVNQVIEESSDYLSNKGKLFFPIISLSDKTSILSKAEKFFSNVVLLDSQDWPMPKEMNEHSQKLIDLKNSEIISFKEKFGILIGTTEIYVAYN